MRNHRLLPFTRSLVAVLLTAAPYAHATSIDSTSAKTTADDVVLAAHQLPPGAAPPVTPGHHRVHDGADLKRAGNNRKRVNGHGYTHVSRPTGNAARPKHKIMEKLHGAKEKIASAGRKIKRKFGK